MSTEPAAGLPKLAAPARRALAAAGYSSLTQLAQAKADDIAALHGMGPNAMKALRQALQEHGPIVPRQRRRLTAAAAP